jgi:hypothetical protein
MAATAITISGGSGSDTINFSFLVTGTATTLYAQNFANTVNNLLSTVSGGPTTPLDPGTSPTGASGSVYVLDASTVSGLDSYTVGASSYAVDSLNAGAAISLDGSDSILVGGVNAEATVTGAGTGNQVIFVDGQNEYLGTSDSGGDTVVSGSGQDTIYTSAAGSSTVYTGTGQASIYLQDTSSLYTDSTDSAFAAFNDFVYLEDGQNTVYANGTHDAIFASAPDQTIYGNSASDTVGASFTGVVLLPNSDGSVVNGLNSDTVAVFDFTSNNTINGGTGALYYIGGTSVTAAVNIGIGNTYIYGADGDNITLGTQTGDTTGLGYFVAGTGNETLNGAAATSTLYLFGGSISSDSVAPTDSLVGGAGANLFVAGAGSETLQGGSGSNFFEISDSGSANANLLLTDFATNGTPDQLYLVGFSSSDLSNLYADTVTSGGNLVATIGNSTTITFTGITSGSQLQGHIITFS